MKQQLLAWIALHPGDTAADIAIGLDAERGITAATLSNMHKAYEVEARAIWITKDHVRQPVYHYYLPGDSMSISAQQAYEQGFRAGVESVIDMAVKSFDKKKEV